MTVHAIDNRAQTPSEVISHLSDFGLKIVKGERHYKVYDPVSGAWLFDVSKSPSDHNWFYGLRRHLRRIGIIDKELSELGKVNNRKKNWRKFGAIDLEALRRAQDAAAAAGEHIPQVEDLSSNPTLLKRRHDGSSTSFTVAAQEFATGDIEPMAITPAQSRTKSRLKARLENDDMSASNFARTAIEVANKRNLQCWPNESAATQSISAFLRKEDKGLRIWAINVIEATLDEMDGLRWGKIETPTEDTGTPEVEDRPAPIESLLTEEDYEVMKEDASEDLPITHSERYVSDFENLNSRYAAALLTMLERNAIHGDNIEPILTRLDQLLGINQVS